MLAFLSKWHRPRPYKAITGCESGGEEQPMVKEENASSILNDEEDESSTLSFHHISEKRLQRGYSLASVTMLFGLGVILGSFIPRWISHNTIPLSFVPELSLKEYVFDDAPEFSSQAPDHGNSSWASLLPPRNGMIEIGDPESYGLRPGLPLYSNRNPPNAVRKKYALSVFHQLHCLQMLREDYLIHIGIFQGASEHQSHAAGDHEKAHLEHCLDYLRQSVMCCADTTVEWANPHAGPTQKPLIDGWGVPHGQCKDWDKLLEFITEHQAPLVVEE